MKTLEDHLKQEQESKAPNWSNLPHCQPLSRVRVNLWSKMAKPSWQFENLSQLCFVPKFPPIFHLLGICPRPIRCIRVHYPGNLLLVLPSFPSLIFFLQIQQMNGRSTHLDNPFYHNHYDLKCTKQVSAPSNYKGLFQNWLQTQKMPLDTDKICGFCVLHDRHCRSGPLPASDNDKHPPFTILLCSMGGLYIHQQFALNYQT